ncbi:MAG: lipopolysaccharide biosynthesis protein [Sphingorhabdus sp.]
MSGPQEEALVEVQVQTVDRSDVAKGAGLAAAARLGALIEIVSQPAYTWMFGLTGYGVYVVLWAAVNILANLLDLAMGQALQRIVPASASHEERHGVVRFALMASTGLGIMAALAISLTAPMIASAVASAPSDAAQLPQAIAIFAWSLPLWVFIETATAAARAMRAFGPEIRLRIFWEQVARLFFASGFFFAGFGFEGLLFGHLASLALTAWLSWKLLARYYDPALLMRASLPRSLRKETLATGFAMLPPALARRAYNDLPPILLNAMVPGSAGAAAAGIFGIARKIASIPLIVRQSFLYVLAPLASAQAALDRREIAPLYSFSTHISLLLAVPIAGFLILVAADMLTGFAPGTQAGLGVVLILLAARAVEAALGPATPIVEMIGHRALPLMNSLAGLAVWLALGLWLVPERGVEGMALAVAAAVVLTALLAIAELYWSDRICPFGHGFWRALVAALGCVVLLWGVGELLSPFGQRIRALSLLFLFWPSLWLTLKIGLLPDDKAGLGKLASKLRL